MFLKSRTKVDPVLTDIPVNFGEHTTPGCGVFRLPRGARRASAAGFAQPRAPAPLHAHTSSATTTASVRSATVCIRELLHSSAYVPKTTPIRALAVFLQLFWRFRKNPGLFWRGFCEVDCGRLPCAIFTMSATASFFDAISSRQGTVAGPAPFDRRAILRPLGSERRAFLRSTQQ